jgi:hypothetical protein
MKVPFGFHEKSNRFLGIDEVKNGLACKCICPSCNMKLKARQGEENEHHFAHHHPKDEKRAKKDCEYSYWVSVRSMAKQLIIEHKYLSFDQNIKKLNPILAITFSSISSEPTINSYQFDLKVISSIGSIYIYFITSEEDTGRERKHYHDNPKYFNNKLILEIDISTIKEDKNNPLMYLKFLLFEESKNKSFLAPQYPFKQKSDFIISPLKSIKKSTTKKSLPLYIKAFNKLPFSILEKAKNFYICQSNDFKDYNKLFNQDGRFKKISSNNKDLFFVTYQGYFCCFILYDGDYYAFSIEDIEVIPYAIKQNSFFYTQKTYIALMDEEIKTYF